MFAGLGDFIEVGCIFLVERGGQPMSLVAEGQPAGGREGNLIEGACTARAQEVDLLGLVLGEELCPRGVDLQIEMGPVIEAAAADGFFGQGEPEWLNQVQACAEADAEAPDGPGVVGDQRLDQDYMQ